VKTSRAAREDGESGTVLRATLEYDGSRYRGWQAQLNARTVQGTLLEVLRQALGPSVRVNGAGRTDAGVHALGQVASVHLPRGERLPDLGALRRTINGLLPADINVLSLTTVPPGFHARHDAVLRFYRYRIARRKTAFGKPWVYWVRDPLDVAAMRRSAERLVGRHDFASFCENPEGHESTLVEVSLASVETARSEPDLVIFRIGASHFLWKMVRRVVGTLLEVGAGRIPESRVAELLTTRSSEPARLTVPPSGLFLEAVLYPGDPVPADVAAPRPAF
jgi:tRNA pseudouridine38-40 synthase